jgi:hypothetical protein
MKKLFFSLLAVLLFVSISFASTPIKLSLFETIAAPPDSDVIGLELGIGARYRSINGASINLLYGNTEHVKGVQIGILNVANSVNGLQLGFVNVTSDMRGAQLGIVNVIRNSTVFPWTVIFNMYF